MTASRILAGAVVIATALLTASGCAAATPNTDEAMPDPDPTPSPSPVEMTCESIMRASFVERLSELGWSAQPSEFRIGEHEVPGGIQCVWGDFEHGTDVAQMYGWAPVDEAAATTLQSYLEDNGWTREEADGYVYVTENPEYASYADEDGYGMTYQFAPDWVALADTKSGLALVTWRG